MDVTAIVSLTILMVIIGTIALSAIKSPTLFKLGKNFFLRKKRLTVMAVLGLVVAPTIITGSLTVGDSMKASVIEEVYRNLGNIDETIDSDGLFNVSVFDSIKIDSDVAGITDALAPLLMLQASVRNQATSLFESKSNIIGFDNHLLEIGEFYNIGGGTYPGQIELNQAVINNQLGQKIGVRVGDTVTITTRNPEFSVESIYSLLSKPISFSVSIVAVIDDKGLGRMNLETGSKIPSNLFVNLTYLQSAIGSLSKINTIIVSNNGNEHDGVRLTNEVTTSLQTALDETIGYQDVKFNIDVFNYIRFENSNVFFDDSYFDIIESIADQISGIESISPLTSYFVNNLSFNGNSIAYSTVTGLIPQVDHSFGSFVDNTTGLEIIGDIQDDEMIITSYTAGRLNASVGSVVTMNYTIYDSTFSPVYMESSHIVRHIVDITGKAFDSNLMPPFPGIRGTSSCAEWEPPWIEGDKMRNEMVWEDLTYWETYGGTPKAYITLTTAQQLWSNDIGNLTTIKIKSSNLSQVASQIGANLNTTIMAGDAGIMISNIKEDGIESAEGVQLLTETFISFGAVVIISGIILVGALVGMMMEGRRKEIGILKTIGTKRGQVTKAFAYEALFLSIISSAIGIFVGLLVAFICIYLTNTFWTNIIEGSTVTLYFTTETLIVGYVAGFIISFLAFVMFAYRNSKTLLAELFREFETPKRRKASLLLPAMLISLGVIFTLSALFIKMDDSFLSLAGLMGPVFILLSAPIILKDTSKRGAILRICALLTIIHTFVFDWVFMTISESTPFILFFLSGFVIVFASVIGLATSMRWLGTFLSRMYSIRGLRAGAIKIAFLSPSRRIRRTCLTVTLFAIVIFTFFGLSANIQGQQQNLSDLIRHQGAGYDVFAQSSLSIRFDLGSPEDRVKNNLSDFPLGTSVVQFLTFGQPGGSCSNLKRNLPPKLIAVNEIFTVESTLRFQSPKDDGLSLWMRLDVSQPDGSIPTIGDYNTIVWILGKDIGAKIRITDERGEDRELVVVGIIENSIFPGSVFISEENINNLYPTTAEYNLFLFKTTNATELVSYLETSMESYGMDASRVDELVESNLSVEWSYMSLFQTLLLMGLFVGIFALAISISRSIEERRSEIGTMRALGFKRSMVRNLMLAETQFIALVSIVIGIVAGLLTSFAIFGRGSLISYGSAIPLVALFLVLLIVEGITGLATIVPAMKAAKMNPVEALKMEQ